jgi:hypothetical protein
MIDFMVFNDKHHMEYSEKIDCEFDEVNENLFKVAFKEFDFCEVSTTEIIETNETVELKLYKKSGRLLGSVLAK